MLVKIVGMSCEHCKKRVENALKNLGATSVLVDLVNNTASFEDISIDSAITAIEDLGFEAEK